MVIKEVQIVFSDPRIKAIDHIVDIREAAQSAGLNLYSRHDVRLGYPMPYGDKVIVEVKIPEEIANEFKIGPHLKGIANYLLNSCNFNYGKYAVGSRLLTCIECDTEKENKDEFEKITTVDKIEAIVKFARLLERTDDVSEKQIEAILSILEKSK